MQSYGRELQAGLEAVRRAAALCAAVQREDAANRVDKSDRSPVTVADLVSQAVVAQVLRERFPNDPLVAEEEADVFDGPGGQQLRDRVHAYLQRDLKLASVEDLLRWIQHGARRRDFRDRFWVLDPVDGTKGFLRGEQYAIALALLEDRRVVLAVLGCPNLPMSGIGLTAPGEGVVLYAVRGQGAFMYPLDGSRAAVSIHVSSRTVGEPIRVCQSAEPSHSAADLASRVAEAIGCTCQPVRMDSQAKYALVARGDADLYVRVSRKPGYREKIWDHAAGTLIVEEAGGRVTDAAGRPLDFGCGIRLENNVGIVCSNGILHDNAVQALAQIAGGAA